VFKELLRHAHIVKTQRMVFYFHRYSNSGSSTRGNVGQSPLDSGHSPQSEWGNPKHSVL